MAKHNSFKKNCIKKLWWILVWYTLETLFQRSSTSTANCCFPTSNFEQISSDAMGQGESEGLETSIYSKDWRLGCDSQKKPVVERRMAPVAGVETAWGSFKLFTSTRHIKNAGLLTLNTVYTILRLWFPNSASPSRLSLTLILTWFPLLKKKNESHRSQRRRNWSVFTFVSLPPLWPLVS